MRFRLFLTAALACQLASAQPTGKTPDEVRVMSGIDVLVAQDFGPLKGKQIGLITNHTGRDGNGHSTADILSKAPGVRLIALFSPEHGIRGRAEAGQIVGDMIDPKTKLPVYSLYGIVQKPTPEMLNAIDVMVFDMQDVGARFYTYLTTMGLCMEAAAKRKIGFMVLDRPNPLGGDVVEGQVLDPRVRHFTAYYSIPVRHGLTAGELAKWYNETMRLGLKLDISPLARWKRDMLYDDTGLSFIAPSPNIRTPRQALLYAGLGIFEATNLSVGRGTDEPFEKMGAPWINGAVLAQRLEALNLPGFRFVSTMFTPTKELYQGQSCSGVRVIVTDADAARPVDLFVHTSVLLRELWGKEFQLRWDEMVRVTGSRDFENLYKMNMPADKILEVFHKSAEQFKDSRKSFLLY